MTTENSAAEILSVIRRIDSAWRNGPPDEIVARITPCFDENVVFCASNFRVVASGAQACAASYEQFVRMATVRAFEAPDPEIHVAGEAATAVCPWTMTYTLNNETYTESGHVVFVFTHRSGEWRAMWRAMLPAPS
jgi:hypothetical protein